MLLAVFAVGFALMSFAISKFCKNYISVLAAMIPVFVVGDFICKWVFQNLLNVFKPECVEVWLCAGILLAGLLLTSSLSSGKKSIYLENYDYMVPRANVILQLHRDLYHFSPSSIGGNFKNADNIIAETDAIGNRKVRFQPLSAFETPEAVDRLTNTVIEAINVEKYDPLLLIPMFILDFLCIHPFNDGNGRMSRLLTLLLLYRSGYIIGKYISIEMVIEKAKGTYYQVLKSSSEGWQEYKNSYLPFVKYYLEVILSAYKAFSARVELMQNRNLTKPERIRVLFGSTLHKLSKRDILEKCPDISASTVEVTLSALLKEDYIIKTSSGKNAAYIRNMENDK